MIEIKVVPSDLLYIPLSFGSSAFPFKPKLWMCSLVVTSLALELILVGMIPGEL